MFVRCPFGVVVALVYLAATTELGLPGAALAYALPPVIAAATVRR